MRDVGTIVAEVELALDILGVLDDIEKDREQMFAGGGTGQPVSSGGVSSHNDLTNVTSNQHHTKYTDAEAEIVADAQIATHAAISNAHHAKTVSGDIDHNATINFFPNEHIDHSAVNVIAGIGLSGGGDITGDVTLNVDNIETLPTALTAGSVVFSDGSNLAQDNANFFWDDSNKSLRLFELQSPDGINGNVDGKDLSLRAGDAFAASDGDGGDLFIYAGLLDGAGAAGNLYLGSVFDGGGPQGLVWFQNETGAHFGDVTMNSAKIYHDGTDLVIDPRFTGTGGTLLFQANASFEGDVNFDQVDEITNAEAGNIELQEEIGAGTLPAGTYFYDFYYITANGQTSSIQTQHGTGSVPTTTVSANGEISIGNIPTSTDRRVTGRGIMRTQAGEAGFLAQTIAVINDNTTDSYVDSGDAAGTGALNFKKPNTTAGAITIETQSFTVLNDYHTFIGLSAGLASIAPDNVAVGNLAFLAAITATDCVSVGTKAGWDHTTGDTAVYIGSNAGVGITTGSHNTLVGGFSQPDSTGIDVVGLAGFGKDALKDGPGLGQNYSAGFGFEAGKNFGGTGNLFLGGFAGSLAARIAASDFNIVIGYLSGTTFENGADSNIIIGHNVEPDTPGGSNQLEIGGIIKGDMTSGSEKVWFPLGNVGIGTDSPGALLHIVSGDSGFTASTLVDDLVIESSAATMGVTLLGGNKQSIWFADGNNDVGQINYFHAASGNMIANSMDFWTLNQQRLKLDHVNMDYIGAALKIGADSTGGQRTDATRKLGRMFAPPYTNSDRPINVFLADSDGTDNKIGFGDGSSLGNKATEIRFTTGPTDTTMGSGAVDTSVMKINKSQQTQIGAPGVGTNYVQIDGGGDVTFVGGAGLQFAGMYKVGNAVANTFAGSGIANKTQYLQFDTNNGINGSIPDHTNDHITVSKTGWYSINVAITAQSSGAGGRTISFDVYKNNGATAITNLHAHRDMAGGGGEIGSIVLSGLVNLTANDTIEVWVHNKTGSENVILEDVDLSIVQVGG